MNTEVAARVLVNGVHALLCPPSLVGHEEDAGGKPPQRKPVGLWGLGHTHSIRVPFPVAALLRSPTLGAQLQEAGRGQGTRTKGSRAESSQAEPPATHAAGSGI